MRKTPLILAVGVVAALILGDVIENGMTVSTDASDNVDPNADIDAYMEHIAKGTKK